MVAPEAAPAEVEEKQCENCESFKDRKESESGMISGVNLFSRSCGFFQQLLLHEIL
jgi:hypothetical protein